MYYSKETLALFLSLSLSLAIYLSTYLSIYLSIKLAFDKLLQPSSKTCIMEHIFCQCTISNINNVIICVTIIYKVIHSLSLLEAQITKWSNRIIQTLFFGILCKLLNLELYNLRFNRIISLIILLSSSIIENKQGV